MRITRCRDCGENIYHHDMPVDGVVPYDQPHVCEPAPRVARAAEYASDGVSVEFSPVSAVCVERRGSPVLSRLKGRLLMTDASVRKLRDALDAYLNR